MTVTQILVIISIAIPISLATFNKIGLDLAGLCIVVALGTAQFFGAPVLGPAHSPADAIKSITGFGQPVILTLVGLFILTYGLDKTGITRAIARGMLRIGKTSEWRLIGLFSLTAAVLSLFMNNLASGALVLPTAMEVSRRTGIKPSKLLIPVAYGSILGGTATYFTTANIIASDMLRIAQPPQTPLHILDFTPTGGLILILGVSFLTAFGRKILPDRAPVPEQLMSRPTGSQLESRYRLTDRFWELKVLDSSPFVGQTLIEADIARQFNVIVAAIWRGRRALFSPDPDQTLMIGDILLVVGESSRIQELAAFGLFAGRTPLTGGVSGLGVHFVELMPAPHSAALGLTLKQLQFRKKYGLTAVAMWRKDRGYCCDIADFKLAIGDSFLMIGPRTSIESLQRNPDFIVLESSRSDEPALRREATISAGILGASTVASILGLPVYISMLAGALLLVFTRIIRMEEAYRAIEWNAIFLIAGMYPASIAIVQTGLAATIGHQILLSLSGFGPLGLAAAAYLLSAILTQLMGAPVTILVTAPIAISAAIASHTNPQAIVVAAAIGCSASFLTPISHPVNALVVAPANYRFNDFLRAGWALMIISFAGVLLGMVIFWDL